MKKSLDSRDVFAVFKKDSFMKDASFGKKLAYWFKNVYWCYFALPTVAIIVAILLAGVLVNDILHPKYNDLDYIVAGSLVADKTQMEHLSEKMTTFLNPRDSGEKPTIGWQMLSTRSVLDFNEATKEMDGASRANVEKIAVTMVDNDILLFFFDKKYIEYYAADGAFEPLSNFGIESENEYYVRVDNTEFFKDITIHNSDGIYAGIKVRSGPRLKKKMDEKYANAARVLSGILAYKG